VSSLLPNQNSNPLQKSRKGKNNNNNKRKAKQPKKSTKNKREGDDAKIKDEQRRNPESPKCWPPPAWIRECKEQQLVAHTAREFFSKFKKIKNSSTVAAVAATTVQEHYTNTKIFFEVLRENRTELQRDRLRLSRERRKRDKTDRQTSQTREKAKRERERERERDQARDGNSEPCVARLKLHGISNSFSSRGWKEGKAGGKRKRKEGRESFGVGGEWWVRKRQFTAM
jgi:hypothetical protein